MNPLLAALPADGSPIVAALAVERSGLTPGAAWPLLVALCGDGRARAWRHEGVTWARRVRRDALTRHGLDGTTDENAQGVATKANAPGCNPRRSGERNDERA